MPQIKLRRGPFFNKISGYKLALMKSGSNILAIAGALAAATALTVSGASAQDGNYPFALAQQSNSNPFSALVGERRERRADPTRGKVERYVLASDNRSFLIETRARTARVKFLCGAEDRRLDCTLDAAAPAPEIYLLTVTRGPRGDVIFKNADGDTLLRLASYGGATVYWPGDAAGLAASKSFGDDRAIELAAVDIDTAERRAKSATAVVSAVTGSPITFDIAQPPPGESANAAVLADAVMRAANAVNAVAGDATGARILAARIDRIQFEVGPAPSARFDERALIVEYVPDRDIAGRLSSRAIERFLEESL